MASLPAFCRICSSQQARHEVVPGHAGFCARDLDTVALIISAVCSFGLADHKCQSLVCTPRNPPEDMQTCTHQEGADGEQSITGPSMHGAAPTVYDRDVMPSSAVTTMGTWSALPGDSPTMTAMGQKLLLSLQAAQHQRRLPAEAGPCGACFRVLGLKGTLNPKP